MQRVFPPDCLRIFLRFQEDALACGGARLLLKSASLQLIDDIV